MLRNLFINKGGVCAFYPAAPGSILGDSKNLVSMLPRFFNTALLTWERSIVSNANAADVLVGSYVVMNLYVNQNLNRPRIKALKTI